MGMPQLVLHRFALSVVTTSEHLSATDIAAFIDHSLPLDRRARAESHLSTCDRCREELASCARLASNAPLPAQRRMAWRLVGLAAAALMIAVLLRPITGREHFDASRERAPAGTSARMVTVFPPRDAQVTRSSLRFVWRRDDRSDSYRVIVTDASGAPAWTHDTADTTASPPPTMALNTDRRYFWRVEALHADGSVAQSSETPFRIRPE